MRKYFAFLQKNNKTILVLLIIVLVAAFVRLYRISDYMHFLGDEGRDVLVVKRTLIDHKITLLGPVTSVGSIYLGPIYYYMMAPFLYVFNMNPVGPAVMIALLSIFTVILIYLIGMEYFSWSMAIIASTLYALSPLVIFYSRFSWNPNAVPFFVLLLVYSLMKIVLKEKSNWSFVCGLCLGVILQLHYLALMFIPIIFAVLLLFRKLNLKALFKIIIGTIITFSPFLIFELRHGFPNTQTVIRFATRTGDTATFALNKFSFIIIDLTTRSFWRMIVVESNLFTKLLIIFLIVSIILIFKDKQVKTLTKNALKILLLWFGIAMVSYGLYQGAIYDYYMVQIFPIPAILTGIVLSWYITKKKILRIISIAIFILLVAYLLKNSPLLAEPNRLLYLTQQRAKFIYDRLENKPYNFALISGMNSDHAYRYFLELWGVSPTAIQNPQIDPQRLTVTDQLFVICEIECSPLGYPLWEVAGFGRAEIEDSWNYEGVTIYKLKHYL